MVKCEIPIPTDVITGKMFSETAEATLKASAEVVDDDMIFDIGPDTSATLSDIIRQAKTIIWNGPVGVFEFDQFGAGYQSRCLTLSRRVMPFQSRVAAIRLRLWINIILRIKFLISPLAAVLF